MSPTKPPPNTITARELFESEMLAAKCSCPTIKIVKEDPFLTEYDRYAHYLDYLEKKRIPSKEFDLNGFIAEAQKEAKKVYLTLEDFRGAKDLCKIERILRSSKYPEDDESPSGKQFIPLLLLKRCKLILDEKISAKEKKKKGSNSQQLLKELLLRDLNLVEKKWMEYLPYSLHHSLYYLKMRCQLRLELFADAKVSHDEALQALEDVSEDEDAKEMRTRLSIGLSVIKANKAMNKIAAAKPISTLRNTFDPEGRTMAKGLVLQLGYYKKMEAGKEFFVPCKLNFVADRDFMPGDVLALEKPVQQVLMPIINTCKAKELCHKCLKDTLNLSYPCPGCSLATFCSTECRDLALQSFHKYECKLGLAWMCRSKAFSRVSSVLRTVFTLGREGWLNSSLYAMVKGKEEDSTEEDDDEEDWTDDSSQSTEEVLEDKAIKDDNKNSSDTSLQNKVESRRTLKAKRRGKNQVHEEEENEQDEESKSKDIASLTESLDSLSLESTKDLHSYIEIRVQGPKFSDNVETADPPYIHYRMVELAARHAWELVKESKMLDPITPEIEANSFRAIQMLAYDGQRGLIELRKACDPSFTSDGRFLSAVRTVGHGLFRNISDVSHSCLPNARYFDVEGETAIVAIRAIDKGEEITIPHHLEITEHHAFRKRTLWNMRRLNCECHACQNHWNGDQYTQRELQRRKGIRQAFAQLHKRGSFEPESMMKELVKDSMGWKRSMNRETYALWSNINCDGVVMAIASKYCRQ